MSDTRFQHDILGEGSAFEPTCWSRLLAAGRGEMQGLEEFCQRYWHPLYAFARRQGQSPANAQDVTQGFFSWLIERQQLQLVEQGQGRFRNFLLIQFKSFIYKQYRHDQAQKRGGANVHIDFSLAEESLADDESLGAEESFDRSWAHSLLKMALEQMQAQYAKRNDLPRFIILRGFVDSSHELSLTQAAEKIGCSENALHVSVHRFRSQFRQQLRHQVELTLHPEGDVEEEIRYLASLLRK